MGVKIAFPIAFMAEFSFGVTMGWTGVKQGTKKEKVFALIEPLFAKCVRKP